MEKAAIVRVQREREHFDDAAKADEVFLGNEEFDYFDHPCMPENHLLLELCKGQLKGKRVLDIGCGVGEAAVAFAKRGAIVSAIDVSSKAISIGKEMAKREKVKVDFQTTDSYHLPFKDGEFDIIYGNGVLHHLDIKMSTPELARVLNPKGLGFFIEPTLGNPLIAIYRVLAHSKRSEDERPLNKTDFRTLRRSFPSVEQVPFQVTTLLIFLRMFFFEFKHPNKVSYWREVILRHEGYQKFYRWAARRDDGFRKVFPRLFSWLCWNNVVLLRKK